YDTCKTQYPTKDFRDIWAIDQHTAVAMSISDSAVIIKTTDGGNSWKTVYHDETPGIFLDVIEIDPKTGVGIVLGDPLSQNQQSQKHFKALLTTDFGNSWINIPDAEWSIPLDTLESFFAASGTSLSIILSKANHKKQQYALTVGFAGGGLNPQFHLLQIGYTPKKSAAQEPQTDQPSAWKFKSLPTLPMTLKGGPAWGCYGLSILVRLPLTPTTSSTNGRQPKHPQMATAVAFVSVKHIPKNTSLTCFFAISKTTATLFTPQ
ncbi:MAG: hypothetical protein RI977_1562, partial [Bacteroidota bacterium]